jgi:nucleoside-diphosphate-sugar epimerase
LKNHFQATTWFITGGTGLVGSTIIEKLREADIAVIALIRKQSPSAVVQWLIDLGVQTVEGDLLDVTSYENYLATCDVVVHSAAIVLEPNPEINYHINLDGTRVLLDTMQKYGVERLVHISSAGVYGTPKKMPILETDGLKPVSVYSKSKLMAEELILREYQDLSVTIIRPPYIFGDYRRDRNLLPTLQKNFAKIFVPKAWRYDPEIGFAHALDIASLVIQSGCMSTTPSEIYNVESFRLKYSDMVAMLSRVYQKRIFQIRIPFLVIYFLGKIVDLSFLLMRKHSLNLGQYSNMLKGNWTFSIARANEELDWVPIFTEPHLLEIELTNLYLEDEGLEPDSDIREEL